MSTPDHPSGNERRWPTDKLNALRLGQGLAAEVPASGPGRRAFVTIDPVSTPADAEAHREGWKRSDRNRGFRLLHWDYDVDHLDGWDYDIGAVLIRSATAGNEPELISTLDAWELRPDQFLYPWQTDTPI
ncbi:hypothetical protein ACFQ07_03145 [Actinomadura adrarensis]|uniref:Uncharacterized protein n=1 Tax=Actinomadura adrarensis TaxID=1819600 RepID=A0ABW3C9S3_9ACTN